MTTSSASAMSSASRIPTIGAKRIVLTDRGRESVAAALDTIATLEAELEDLLGSDKVAELHDSLSRILTTSRPSKDAR